MPKDSGGSKKVFRLISGIYPAILMVLLCPVQISAEKHAFYLPGLQVCRSSYYSTEYAENV